MPTPVSATLSTIESFIRPRRTSTDPSWVNLTALATRFSTIFSQSSGSTCDDAEPEVEPGVQGDPRATSGRDPNGCSRSRVSSARSVGSGVAWSPSASMRATSSRPLTMRSRRCALACISSSSSRSIAVGTSGEDVLEGTQQEGQRRTELVADVGQERRLGCVQGGQRLEPRLLAGPLGGDGEDLAHLVGHQAREPLVVVVVGTERVRGQHEDRSRLALDAHGERRRAAVPGRRPRRHAARRRAARRTRPASPGGQGRPPPRGARRRTGVRTRPHAPAADVATSSSAGR